jgi:hypothetical protein
MLNKKLDGEWILLSIDGENIPSTYSKTMKFSKDGKGGEVVYTIIENGQTITKTGKYALIKTNSMSVAFPNSNFGSGYETETFDFTKTSKTDLTLTKISGEYGVYVFKKK